MGKVGKNKQTNKNTKNKNKQNIKKQTKQIKQSVYGTLFERNLFLAVLHRVKTKMQRL